MQTLHWGICHPNFSVASSSLILLHLLPLLNRSRNRWVWTQCLQLKASSIWSMSPCMALYGLCLSSKAMTLVILHSSHLVVQGLCMQTRSAGFWAPGQSSCRLARAYCALRAMPSQRCLMSQVAPTSRPSPRLKPETSPEHWLI